MLPTCPVQGGDLREGSRLTPATPRLHPSGLAGLGCRLVTGEPNLSPPGEQKGNRLYFPGKNLGSGQAQCSGENRMLQDGHLRLCLKEKHAARSAQEEMLLLPSPSSLKGSLRAVMEPGTQLPPPHPLLLLCPCRAVSPVTGTQPGTDRAPLTLSLTHPDRALVTPVLSKTLVPLSPSPSPPHLLIAAASSAQLQPVLSRTALTLSS